MSEWEGLSREDLLALVVAQAHTIEQQARRIAELERRLSRNSGNSSMAPSLILIAVSLPL